jgi:hypothetical protein
VVGHYEDFFIASAGASAAILGLLVVAVSVVNADDANPTTRERRTVLAGSAFVALVDIFIVSIVALTGGDRRPAGQQTADIEGKPGWKFLPQFSIRKAEYRLRIDFGWGLLSAARPRRSAPGEHPECRAAACSGPCHRGFVLQRPWSGMGGHRDNPAGMSHNEPWSLTPWRAETALPPASLPSTWGSAARPR